jgi:hypothetical protein
LRCPNPKGLGETWTRIVRLEIRDADIFIRLHFSNCESLDVTPHHIFTLADGSPMRADRLCLCDVLIARFGRVTLNRIEAVSEDSHKVTVICEPAPEFFAGRFAPNECRIDAIDTSNRHDHRGHLYNGEGPRVVAPSQYGPCRRSEFARHRKRSSRGDNHFTA